MIRTTSLELSKKMKELGIPQENSAFNWYGDYSHKLFTLSTKEQIGFWKPKAPAELPIVGIAAAFLAEEVLEQLPFYIPKGMAMRGVDGCGIHTDLYIKIERSIIDNKWFLYPRPAATSHNHRQGQKPIMMQVDDFDAVREMEENGHEFLAEAAGKCWIWLKEQGLLKGKV